MTAAENKYSTCIKKKAYQTQREALGVAAYQTRKCAHFLRVYQSLFNNAIILAFSCSMS